MYFFEKVYIIFTIKLEIISFPLKKQLFFIYMVLKGLINSQAFSLFIVSVSLPEWFKGFIFPFLAS